MDPGQLDDDGGGRVGGGGARRLSARPVALVDEVGGVGDRWDVPLRPGSCEYGFKDSVVDNVGEGFGARGLVLGHREPEEADGVASSLLVPAVGCSTALWQIFSVDSRTLNKISNASAYSLPTSKAVSN